MGAAGGSSERSWRDSSGSALSSYAGAEGAEGVGATGVEATGVGAGGTSRSNEVADSKGSRGSADSSSNEESVNPGLVATRATSAARALVLPVVDVDAAPGAGEGVDAGATPAWAGVPAVAVVVGAEGVADPLDAPDVGDGAGVGELPSFAGRGGAFAAGGGEAAGAGRAGGTVGIAALGVGFGAVAAAADVAEVAGDAAGRRASEGVVAAEGADAGEPAAGKVDAEAGRVASAARAVGMAGVPELAGRVGAVPVDGDAVDTDAGAAADAVVAPRVAPDAAPVGTAPVLAEGAGARGAVPAAVGG